MTSENAFPVWLEEWHAKLSALINRANMLRATHGQLPHGVESANAVLAEIIREQKRR